MASGTPAIVLGTRPLGESDLLVVLLTPTHGKIRGVARQARRSRRRFAGGLPGGAMGEAELHPPRTAGGLWRLEYFRSVRDVSNLGRDLERFAYVAYLCELSDALLHEPQPDPHVFSALAEALITTVEGDPRAGVLRRFELCLLEALGLLPSLETCCVCGEPGDPDALSVAFDLDRGGLLCPEHGQAGPWVERQTLRLAQDLLEGEQALDAAMAASVDQRRALRDLTARVIRGQLRHPLRSLDFFAQIHGRGATDRTRP